MLNEVILKIPRYAIKQVLDGLYHRLNVWRYTVEYIDTGFVREPYEVADCTSSSEAEKIADCYQEIIRTIEDQISNES
jgi:hypothetical protein